LLLDALETGSGALIARWAKELKKNDFRVVNMLGCHDGIPLLDLRGLVPDERIEQLIETVVARGGYVKKSLRAKERLLSVNATYFSALGESEQRLLFCRAVQLFMPGMPQVWYHRSFRGQKHHEAVLRAGAGGHKEINRTNLNCERVNEALQKDVVQKQLALLRFRNTFSAFGFDAKLTLAKRAINVDFYLGKGRMQGNAWCDFRMRHFLSLDRRAGKHDLFNDNRLIKDSGEKKYESNRV
jgi:sucrose phosphorylase